MGEKSCADILVHLEQRWSFGFSDLPFVRKRKDGFSVRGPSTTYLVSKRIRTQVMVFFDPKILK